MTLPASIQSGVSAALVSMPIAIVFGDLVFNELGEAWVTAGILVFMASHAFIGLLLSLLPTTRYFIFGATSFQAIVYASIITAIYAASPNMQGQHGSLTLICMITVILTAVLSSLMQVIIGFARLSVVLRSIPYPIISSIINVTAIIVMLAQVPYLLGLESEGSWSLADGFGTAKPAVIVNAVVSIGLFFLLPKRLFSIPNFVFAIGFSLAFHYTLLVVPSTAGLVGDTLATVDLIQQVQQVGLELEATRLPSAQTLLSYLPLIVISAALLTVMNSLGTIASNRVLLEKRNVEISSDKLIFRFGLANLLASPFMINGYAKPLSTETVLRPGSNPRLAGLVTALCYILALFVMSQAAFIPRVSLSVLALVFALRLFDSFGRDLFFSVLRLDGRKIRNNFGEYITVMVVVGVELVFGDLIWAIMAGVITSLLDFTYKVSYFRIKEPSFVSMRSNVERSTAHNLLLSQVSQGVTIVRLEGFILFSVAENLFETLRNKVVEDHRLILDFRRVNYVDRTGVEAIGRFVTQAVRNGCLVYGSGFQADSYNQRNSGSWHDLRSKFAEAQQFRNLDEALEALETHLIEVNKDEAQDSVSDRELDLFYGMGPEEITLCKSYMEARVFSEGEVMTEENSVSDELFCITSGRADIILHDNEARPESLRLASFTAGAVVGEMSFIDGAPRSASIMAHQKTHCLVLSRETFKDVEKNHPGIAVALVNNLARSISYRLRFTNRQSENGD